MRISLPDVNVLVALHDSTHPGHDASHEWFIQEGQQGWATCPLTENGFVRVFTQTRYPNNVSGVSSALYILENMVQVYGTTHHFWPDSVSLRERTLIHAATIAGPKQITDVYLLGLCQQNGGTLVTLDKTITKPPSSPLTPTCFVFYKSCLLPALCNIVLRPSAWHRILQPSIGRIARPKELFWWCFFRRNCCAQQNLLLLLSWF